MLLHAAGLQEHLLNGKVMCGVVFRGDLSLNDGCKVLQITVIGSHGGWQFDLMSTATETAHTVFKCQQKSKRLQWLDHSCSF